MSQQWKCKRCKSLVKCIDGYLSCNCITSPSPWELVDDKQEYVLGFVFDKQLKHILLIKKNKSPEGLGDKMFGLLNGLGGKIEPNETPIHAMRRELKEEADLDIPEEKWTQYCKLNAKFGVVYCFYTIVDSFYKFEQIRDEIPFWRSKCIYKSNESEEVGDYNLKAYSDASICGDYTYVPHMPNIQWLIPMALNHYNKTDTVSFEVNEL